MLEDIERRLEHGHLQHGRCSNAPLGDALGCMVLSGKCERICMPVRPCMCAHVGFDFKIAIHLVSLRLVMMNSNSVLSVERTQAILAEPVEQPRDAVEQHTRKQERLDLR